MREMTVLSRILVLALALRMALRRLRSPLIVLFHAPLPRMRS